MTFGEGNVFTGIIAKGEGGRASNIKICHMVAVADPGFSKWGALFCRKWGAHILFSGKKCMKLKEIGLKWGGARLLVPCYSKISIFL